MFWNYISANAEKQCPSSTSFNFAYHSWMERKDETFDTGVESRLIKVCLISKMMVWLTSNMPFEQIYKYNIASQTGLLRPTRLSFTSETQYTMEW